MLVGPGDDAAVLRVRNGHVVVSTDLMVEGRHFRRDWAAAEDVGHRAAAQNLSDVNAMGGRATSLTVGLAAPADLPAQWALDFAPRLRRGVRPGRRQVVGGDLTRSRPGHDRGDRARRLHRLPGAAQRRPAGDVLALTGRQGWAAGGLAVLGRGFRSPRVLVEAYRRPAPPYDAGRGRRRGGRHLDDRRLRRAAGRGPAPRRRRPASPIDVRRDAFEVPEPLVAVGSALGADPLGFILGGGDDHALLATFPDGASVPDGWQVGRQRRRTGSGVTVDGGEYDGPTGWTHF